MMKRKINFMIKKMSSSVGKRGLSERELQRKEEQLAKTYGYETDLTHNEESVVQKESPTTPKTGSFKEFLASISTCEKGRKKRKPNVACHAPAKTLDTVEPVTPMTK